VFELGERDQSRAERRDLARPDLPGEIGVDGPHGCADDQRRCAVAVREDERHATSIARVRVSLEVAPGDQGIEQLARRLLADR
jgi:hypothetical protein